MVDLKQYVIQEINYSGGGFKKKNKSDNRYLKSIR